MSSHFLTVPMKNMVLLLLLAPLHRSARPERRVGDVFSVPFIHALRDRATGPRKPVWGRTGMFLPVRALAGFQGAHSDALTEGDVPLIIGITVKRDVMAAMPIRGGLHRRAIAPVGALRIAPFPVLVIDIL